MCHYYTSGSFRLKEASVCDGYFSFFCAKSCQKVSYSGQNESWQDICQRCSEFTSV